MMSPNPERNAEIIRRIVAGETFAQVATALGVSRSTVAGVANRNSHPRVERGPSPPFQDEARVRAAVQRVTEVGLMAASEELAMHHTALYRWWKRLEKIDGVAYPSLAQRTGRRTSKLTGLLDEIVTRRRAGESLSAIARIYGVTGPAIHHALRRAEAA